MYFDYAATTPLDPHVLEAMLPHLKDTWGNPSSPHAKGREAKSALEQSRQTVADLMNCKLQEVIFTGSGSEANSFAIRGVAEKWLETEQKPGHLISQVTEHKATLQTLKQLEAQGWQVTLLFVDETGQIAVEALEAAIQPDTALVTLQWANNETGTLQPVEAVVSLCQERSIPCHLDAMQPIGVLPLPSPLPDLLSLAAHKFYGPKGIGALIARDTVELSPQVRGGDQEFHLRAGTENVPGAVGLAAALEIAISKQPETKTHLETLSQQLIDGLTTLPGISLNGHPTDRLPSICNFHCAGHKGETLVMQLDLADICASTGSACTTGATDPSHVLMAMGRTDAQARENVRLSVGKQTQVAEIESITQVLGTIL